MIHLTRAEARRAQVDRILEACPIPARVIEAVDGRALPAAEIDAVYSRKSLLAPRYPFELGAGEIGCFLSHRKAWQAIVDKGLEAGLVIEDDVEIDSTIFSKALELARKHVGDLGYIQFQTRPVKGPSAVVAREGSVSIVRPQLGQLRTSAQLVSAEHAAHLLALTERFDRPVDSFLQMSWVTSKPLCCAVPPGITDRTAQSGGSTISQKKQLSDRLSREIKRFVYRRRIRACSAKFAQQAE
ncbi:glycosyltransferase family 25 protein [Hoeflea sp.]|uniref:glycosyltransferase family 25 protein n=1 Tax=Hoeflea sp. TaxID=1940281 RepID=UPI003A8EFEF5